ncbi:nucleoside triphosphatase [Weissella viridescens]|uniref:non-canonical purine NTP pyrophosphatase n=1 Tax=Weissella viridescens TaxID=1629 RepID=UPI001D095802|nr:non-canonical purine NTP pyrophosphatase [Weissella viridescens]MCB6839763.1 nucleoside triphosphatase [Weissella viridescens]MCB6846495.1 nucleoside triphosphatase [Weissella viridescens]WJI90789.1 non-canonical purine NTP pyrophosphatase [Weissella viridescens]
MRKPIVIASNNTHKTAEIAEFFALYEQPVVNYRELHAQITFPKETTDNMVENVKMKASTIHALLPNEMILADDSALFVPALPEHFGVTTMREFKAHALKTDAEINQYVLDMVDTVTDRSGYLQSDFYMMLPNGQILTTQAKGGVRIANSPRGANGLDAIVETETGATLGEMPITQRVNYAARGRAVQTIMKALNKD